MAKNLLMRFVVLGVLSVTMFSQIIGVWGCSSTLNKNHSVENEVILEVWTESSPFAKILSIKVYASGAAEFDFFPANRSDDGLSRFRPERKKAQLSEEDFEKIKSFLEKKDLMDAKESYEPRRIRPMSVDSSVTTSVQFTYENRKKTIFLKEDDTYLYLDKPPSYVTAKPNEYPVSLIELLKSVDVINLKLRRGIDPASQ